VAALTFDHIQQRDGSLVHSKCAGQALALSNNTNAELSESGD
jgi:hypothetical protein